MEFENATCENISFIQDQSDLTLEILDNEPGFYQYVIRPMLHPGHEGELCSWLKEMGLMQRSVRCKSPTCNLPMRWTDAKSIDKYQWICIECDMRRHIRDHSFFNQTKCSLKSWLRIILGWCKNVDLQDVVGIMNIKQCVVKRIYEACTNIVVEYVHYHRNDWRLGGDETVVLIDFYPDGCAKISGNNPEYQNNNPTQILCIAEAKAIPTNYWFHVMTANDLETAKAEALRVVRNMVKPGSILVADTNAKVCSYEELLDLKEYPTIVSIQDLTMHNRPNCTILENLEIIWSAAIHICEEAQNYSPQMAQSFLYNTLWRKRYSITPSMALESLLHQIADRYPIDFH